MAGEEGRFTDIIIVLNKSLIDFIRVKRDEMKYSEQHGARVYHLAFINFVILSKISYFFLFGPTMVALYVYIIPPLILQHHNSSYGYAGKEISFKNQIFVHTK